MERIITQYMSKNGIRLHHLISTFDSKQSEILRPEMHYLYEIFILISGKASYKINGKLYTLRPMDCIIIPPNTIHSIEFFSDQPCERISLLFSPSLFPELIDFDFLEHITNANKFSYTIPRKAVEFFNLFNYFQNASNLSKTNDPYIDINFTILLLQFIQELNKAIKSLTTNDSERLHSVKTYKISYNAIRYIRQNLTKKITLTNIANELNLSESYLRQTFKKEVGISISQYLIQQKMSFAQQLLSEGESPTHVAEFLGYDYYSTFYQQYTKQFCTPPKTSSTLETHELWNDDNMLPQNH